MKRIIPLIILLSLILQKAAGQQIARVEQKDLTSEFFQQPRTILIYTPQNYDESTEAEYDVIYIFDAQYRCWFDLCTALLHASYVQEQDENWHDYIVVGVCSPWMPETGYNRNNDFLPQPVSTKSEGTANYGNSLNFKRFIKEELKPWLAKKYNITNHSLAIGHSLGASFVLDAMITDELFDDYIAMSPNFCWDNNRFANDLLSYDFSKNKSSRFVYLTMGNEPEEWGSQGYPEWGEAWKVVKSYADSIHTPKNILLKTAEFLEYEHNKVPLPALLKTLREYYDFRSRPAAVTDPTLYPVRIELTGSGLDGNVFITGNQEALGNWNPSAVKMQSLNDSTKVIELSLTLPAEFKFTKGGWDSEIAVSNGGAGNMKIISPKRIHKKYKTYKK